MFELLGNLLTGHQMSFTQTALVGTGCSKAEMPTKHQFDSLPAYRRALGAEQETCIDLFKLQGVGASLALLQGTLHDVADATELVQCDIAKLLAHIAHKGESGHLRP